MNFRIKGSETNNCKQTKEEEEAYRINYRETHKDDYVDGCLKPMNERMGTQQHAPMTLYKAKRR